MALVHPKSPICTIEQLELFTPLSTCTQVERSISVPHYSISALDGGTNVLEFAVQGSGDQYLDLLKTKLYIKFRILDGNGKLKVAGVPVGTVASNVAPV